MFDPIFLMLLSVSELVASKFSMSYTSSSLVYC